MSAASAAARWLHSATTPFDAEEETAKDLLNEAKALFNEYAIPYANSTEKEQAQELHERYDLSWRHDALHVLLKEGGVFLVENDAHKLTPVEFYCNTQARKQEQIQAIVSCLPKGCEIGIAQVISRYIEALVVEPRTTKHTDGTSGIELVVNSTALDILNRYVGKKREEQKKALAKALENAGIV